ncbi:hypothetical protein IV500_20540 [Paeniglutamicibacter antarcticus]|uniref:Uncharacterized protein n=1 Tax=Arthrobacter terrae TaxID=2935737 RepID=A0A931GA67_9MICC|nr:hypothetical protein [Arthrobacter terrae]MBG0741749.1 hypothetical protein [Arthrobacter terrae]
MVSILAADAAPVMSAKESLCTRAADLLARKYDGGTAGAHVRRLPPSYPAYRRCRTFTALSCDLGWSIVAYSEAFDEVTALHLMYLSD